MSPRARYFFSELSRFVPFGLPQPVQASHPGPAAYFFDLGNAPLSPVTMSLKQAELFGY